MCDSFEYFLDNFVHIEDKQTHQAIKLQLWPEQRRVLPIVTYSKLLEIIKAHQLGFSWLFVAAYTLWRSICIPMHQVVINSFNEDVGQELIKRIEFVRLRLPDPLYPALTTSNLQYLEFGHRDSQGLPVPSTIQVIAATEKGGQSKTPNIMIFDESALNRYVESAYNGSMPGIMAAGGQVILISNAIKTAPGWPFTRALYQGSMQGTNDVTRLFLPWWAHPERSRKPVLDADGSPMLDGKGQAMTEFKLQALRSGGTNGGQMTEEDFQQRYPETEQEAISTLGGSYFGEVLGRHIKSRGGLKGMLTRVLKDKCLRYSPVNTGIMELWRYPYYLIRRDNDEWWSNRYCIGADISEGTGNTYSVGYVKDRLLDELVLRLRTNRMDAYRFANVLWVLSQWYCNVREWTEEKGVVPEPCLICVERTGAGQTTVGRLKDLGANQYVHIAPGKVSVGLSSDLGWSETNQAKYDLSEGLRTWLRTMTGVLYDSTLLDELSTWIQHEGTNKLGPEGGKFGDCVIAAGLTEQASLSMGGSPKRVVKPLTGWRAERQKQLKGGSAWAV